MKNIKDNLIYFSSCLVLGIWTCVFIPIMRYLSGIQFVKMIQSTNDIMYDCHLCSEQMAWYSVIVIFVSILLDIFVNFKFIKTNKIQASSLKKKTKIIIEIIEIIIIFILWEITRCL